MDSLSGSALEWSGPLDEITVRWVGEVRAYGDFKVKRGFLKKFSTLLLGRDERRLVRPYGIFLDASERLLVTDPGTSSLHMMNLKSDEYRVLTQVAGGGGLVSPLGVTGDDQGTFYFTDSATGAVYFGQWDKMPPRKFNKAELVRPTGIAFNRDNWLLYVADTGLHQIVVFGLDGQEKFRIGKRGSEPGQFNFPTDLWIDGSGHLYVNDSLNARIQVFTADGTLLESIGSRGHAPGYFDRPKGLAVDSAGNLYVCDALQDTVEVFDRDGRYRMNFGSRGQKPGQFWLPTGLFIGRDNRIFVADSYNSRIQIFEYTGRTQ
jgi:sugar lactone lactonase YvrE